MEEVNKEITVKAVMENLDSVIGFAEEVLAEADCPHRVCMQIAVSLEEVYANVVNYAYAPLTGECSIQIRLLTEEGSRAVITVRDKGKRFDPLAKEDPDVSLSAQDRQIGGLGIFMVKKSMDSVSYQYEDGENILTMTKSW